MVVIKLLLGLTWAPNTTKEKPVKDNMMLVILALGGLVVWQMTRKTAVVAAPADTKTTIVENSGIPLNVWQGLTGEEIAKLPVTQQTGQVGTETYYKTTQPVAIGATGFSIWGTTESGAMVVSKKDPGEYEPWEWL